MSDDQRILQLLECLLDTGSTPEVVCASCPELLPGLKQRWKQLQGVQAEIEELFPVLGIGAANRVKNSPLIRSGLPQIDGYHVDGVLGRGGIGVVYRARHLKLDRPVAIKMLLSGAHASPTELSRFAREAKIIAGLQHPHLVQVYDVGEFEGCPYFTMELAEGGNLAQKLGGVPQPPAHATQLVVTLSMAIHAAHVGGVVHRDLKPSNILLTADGIMKIRDFGLARRVHGEPDLTLSGARVGTPSYMAPEQMTNRTGEVGPSADLYALGAILYELLTGRPPFLADSAADTERQLIADDPVRPSRLNTGVPRDLETICLKCLQKDPKRRYISASALADDLRHFLNDEPIVARPLGVIGRTFKWGRRRPSQAILLAAAIMLITASIALTVWFLSSRTSRTRTVNADLDLAVDLEREGKWDQARTAFLRASIELGSHGPDELRRRLTEGNRDLDMVDRLDEIELHLADSAGTSKQTQFRDAFKSAFKDAGIQVFDDDQASVAARVRKSPIRIALIAAMNEYLLEDHQAEHPQQTQWLLQVILNSDAHTTEWERRVHDPGTWNDTKALTKLAATAPISSVPVSNLTSLGRRLGREGIPFLEKVQQQYPNDFSVNMSLGDAELQAGNKVEASRYFQAAVALRPSAAKAEHNLAAALLMSGHPDQAIPHLENAINIAPTTTVCHTSLALAFSDVHRNEEAIDQGRVGVTLSPNDAFAHEVLGHCLEVAGHTSEAMIEYHRALALIPRLGYRILPYQSRGPIVYDGTPEQRLADWKAYIATGPEEFKDWYGYAELCLFLQDEDEYRRARIKMLSIFRDTTDPHVAEHVGRACLLLPGSEAETKAAVDLVERANQTDKSKVELGDIYCFRIARELVEYRQGHLQNAVDIACTRSGIALRPMPQLIMAMALYRMGNITEARNALSSGLTMYDWNRDDSADPDGWMFRILRRQAEEMIPPLPPTTDK